MLPGDFPHATELYKLAIPVAHFSPFYCTTPAKPSSGASTAFLDKEGSLKLDIASLCCCLNCKFLVFR